MVKIFIKKEVCLVKYKMDYTITSLQVTKQAYLIYKLKYKFQLYKLKYGYIAAQQ